MDTKLREFDDVMEVRRKQDELLITSLDRTFEMTKSIVLLEAKMSTLDETITRIDRRIDDMHKSLHEEIKSINDSYKEPMQVYRNITGTAVVLRWILATALLVLSVFGALKLKGP